ncbi:MAG: hypothetical protein JNJ54_02890 [Myxococcaceae bacterium]|nr:hypothetical protein [Myxococcaceae bacterium]
MAPALPGQLAAIARRLQPSRRGVTLPDGRRVKHDEAARALEDWLYERFFIAWTTPAGRFADSVGGAPHFTAALLEATGDASWFAPGFRVLSRSAAGVFVVDEVIRLFVAGRDALRPAGAGRGATVRVRMPCAREAAMPGFFCFNARAGRLDDEQPHLKLYLNVTPAFAPALLRWLFSDRSLSRARFDGKVVNDPDAFGRRDTALLYVDPPAVEAVVRSLARLRRQHRRGFRAGVPPFVLPLAPGLGIAESPPGNDESFGAQRCRLTAAGLLEHLRAPRLSAFDAVARQFATRGLDAQRPWLGTLPASWVPRVLRAHQLRAR